MKPFGEEILKHKMLLEELINEYHGKLILVSTAVEVASRAMNFQTAYDFESCLAVMRKAFNVNDGYFVDSADVAPVRCKNCKYWDDTEAEPLCEVLHDGDGVMYSPEPDDFCSYGERREE